MPASTEILNLRGLWPQFTAMQSEQILRGLKNRKFSGGCSLRLLFQLLPAGYAGSSRRWDRHFSRLEKPHFPPMFLRQRAPRARYAVK